MTVAAAGAQAPEAACLDHDLEVFKACADATRLRLLILLAERELCVCELVEALRMPQGKISRHLAVLRQSGLVDHRREGTWIYYSLRSPATPLTRRLRGYLRAVAGDTGVGGDDLRRLSLLADCDAACDPETGARVEGAAP